VIGWYADDVRRANGTGSVRWRAWDRRWEARLTLGSVDGRQVRRSFMAPIIEGESGQDGEVGQRTAIAKLEAARRDLDVGLILAGPRLTVARYLRDWIEVSRHRVRPSTWRRYRGIVEVNLIPAIGHIQLTKLTATAVERMLADQLTAGLSRRTVHHLRTVLRTALRRAERHGLVRSNVAALAEGMPVQDRERPTLTPDVLGAILSAGKGSPIHALLWTAVATGLRLGELLALRWPDVDPEAATLRVGESKTYAGIRTIGIPTPAVKVLRLHAAEQEMARRVAMDAWSGEYVFTRSDGQPLYGTLVHRQWNAIRRPLGLGHVHFHDLRHASNSLLASLGVETKVRMRIMGHATSRTNLDTYTHALPDDLRQAAERMSILLEELG
jgi:integrase